MFINQYETKNFQTSRTIILSNSGSPIEFIRNASQMFQKVAKENEDLVLFLSTLLYSDNYEAIDFNFNVKDYQIALPDGKVVLVELSPSVCKIGGLIVWAEGYVTVDPETFVVHTMDGSEITFEDFVTNALESTSLVDSLSYITDIISKNPNVSSTELNSLINLSFEDMSATALSVVKQFATSFTIGGLSQLQYAIQDYFSAIAQSTVNDDDSLSIYQNEYSINNSMAYTFQVGYKFVSAILTAALTAWNVGVGMIAGFIFSAIEDVIAAVDSNAAITRSDLKDTADNRWFAQPLHTDTNFNYHRYLTDDQKSMLEDVGVITIRGGLCEIIVFLPKTEGATCTAQFFLRCDLVDDIHDMRCVSPFSNVFIDEPLIQDRPSVGTDYRFGVYLNLLQPGSTMVPGYDHRLQTLFPQFFLTQNHSFDLSEDINRFHCVSNSLLSLIVTICLSDRTFVENAWMYAGGAQTLASIFLEIDENRCDDLEDYAYWHQKWEWAFGSYAHQADRSKAWEAVLDVCKNLPKVISILGVKATIPTETWYYPSIVNDPAHFTGEQLTDLLFGMILNDVSLTAPTAYADELVNIHVDVFEYTDISSTNDLWITPPSYSVSAVVGGALLALAIAVAAFVVVKVIKYKISKVVRRIQSNSMKKIDALRKTFNKNPTKENWAPYFRKVAWFNTCAKIVGGGAYNPISGVQGLSFQSSLIAGATGAVLGDLIANTTSNLAVSEATKETITVVSGVANEANANTQALLNSSSGVATVLERNTLALTALNESISDVDSGIQTNNTSLASIQSQLNAISEAIDELALSSGTETPALTQKIQEISDYCLLIKALIKSTT